MSATKLLKVRVSLKGRPLKSYTFTQDVITVGRNPESDIFLDNPGISRDHVRLEMTTRGFYAAEDLGSANGTFLNDQQIKREYLMNNDVLRIGKFSLWVSYEEDRRDVSEEKAVPLSSFQGTTVLSVDELEGMIATSKESDRAAVNTDENSASFAKPSAEDTSKRPIGSPLFMMLMIVLSFFLGTVVGAPWLNAH
jgi:pSer/pThr/pTyr-binding forkhead associated (FHA) protein